jgi:hypothetical protein
VELVAARNRCLRDNKAFREITLKNSMGAARLVFEQRAALERAALTPQLICRPNVAF